MRQIGLYFFLYFTCINHFASSAATDTLYIKSDVFAIPILSADVTMEKNLSPDLSAQYQFHETELPLTCKSDLLLRRMIRFKGNVKTETILETLGFHYVDVFLKNLSDNSIQHKKTGRQVAYPENELIQTDSEVNKVKLTLEPNSEYELLIFYRNPYDEKIKIELSLTDIVSWENNLHSEKHSIIFWHGVFFSTLFLLFLVNFVFYYLFRDRTYMVYVAYIFTILLYEAALMNYFDHTWIVYFPKLFHIINNTTLILLIVFYLQFLRSFIDLPKNYPWWNVAVNYIIAFLIVVVVATNILFLIDRPISGYFYRNLGLLVFIPVSIIFLSFVVLSKRLVDRILFTGTVVLVVSGFVSLVAFFKGNPHYSDLYFQAGIIIELIIFNIGLGVRSKILQNDKDEELHSLILKLKESEENQKNLNLNLELKVDERTAKINEINHELTSQRDQLFDQKETIEKQLGELHDIRKNLVKSVNKKTEELQHANKELVAQNAQLEQYAFITAHNLKAPVARLKGLVNIFELTNEPSNPNNELINRIKEASLDMDDVIRDINKILEIKNFNQQDRSEIKIEYLIQKIAKRLDDKISEGNIKIETDLKISHIRSNETYLESIFYNLIYNGIKYHNGAGNSFVKISSYQIKDGVYIEVTDNGIGIDLDRFGKKIFGLYQRFHDHVNGKGIGLYLVKTQVEALDGKISLESEVGKGTVFKIEFPA